MSTTLPTEARQFRTLITEDGKLKLTIENVTVQQPKPHEVVVKLEAAPINPSDLALIVGPADLSTASFDGTTMTAEVSAPGLRAVAGRVGQSLPSGNEGAGVVVAAGDNPEAQALIGKTVGCFGGEMFAEYRTIPAQQCLPMMEGVTSAEAASCFVNPMTALSFIETMKADGYSALVHTAAASNLGQMLNKICIADGIDIVNIVRKPEQEQILRDIGAKYIVNSSSDDFLPSLMSAIEETDAFLGFDAIGGGPLAGQILMAMEAVGSKKAGEYSRYGSDEPKHVYVYGRLDLSPVQIPPGVGLKWGVAGWLLTPKLQEFGIEKVIELRTRVAKEIKTTFASHYSKEISLEDMLNPDIARAYDAKATGEKYLVVPN